MITKAQAVAAWVQLGRPRVDIEQLRRGMEVERDCWGGGDGGSDLLLAAELAIDHLSKDSRHYSRVFTQMPRAKITPNPSSAKREFNALFAALDRMFPDFGTLTLVEDDAAHDGGRHYAYCGRSNHGAMEIAFAGAAGDDLRPENMRAMMAHEMGHALDFRYGKQQLTERLCWRLSDDDAELRADQIAEAVFLFPIRYDAKRAYLQTTGPGVYPRPKGLR